MNREELGTLVRRAGEFLGVVGRRNDRIDMSWIDTGEWRHQMAPRAITLTLPATEGRYRLTVTASRTDGSRAQSTRELELRGSDTP